MKMVKLAKFIGYRCLICGEEHDSVGKHSPTLLFTNGYPNGLCPMTDRWMGITHEGEGVWSETIFDYSYGEVRDDFWKLDSNARDEIENNLTV